MKKMFYMALFLGLVSCFAGFSLSYVHDLTEEIINTNNLNNEMKNLTMMYPDKEFKKLDYKDDVVLKVYQSDDLYIFNTSTFGYNKSQAISLLIAIKEHEILKMVVLGEQETDGYGSKCFEDSFINDNYHYKNNSDDISITSSASYTSKAIKEAIDKAFMIYEEMEAE